MKLLAVALRCLAPTDPAEREELTKIAASMEGDYGKGKYCPEGDKGKCLSLSISEDVMTNSRDPEELKKAWLGWHQIAVPIRKDYVRFIELSNKGAKEMGFKDTGAMWRRSTTWSPTHSPLRWSVSGRASEATLRFALHLHSSQAF